MATNIKPVIHTGGRQPIPQASPTVLNANNQPAVVNAPVVVYTGQRKPLPRK